MLSGIFPPLPTPFKEDGALDLEALRANVEQLNPTGLSGYLALGSNSEAVHVTPDEASQVYATVCTAAAPDKVVIGGTGQFSTQATIEMTKRAADAGCAAALIITPFYYKNSMTAEALRAHYHAIADVSPIPVMIYNVPANTGFNITPNIVADIAQHPNVIGMKDSAGNLPVFAQYLEAQSPTFRVLTGSGATVVPAVQAGASGAILAIGLYAGPAVRLMYDAARAGRVAEAAAMQVRLAPIATDIGGAMGPAGIKAAMDLVGLHGGQPRSPLLPVTAEELAIVRARLESAGVLPT